MGIKVVTGWPVASPSVPSHCFNSGVSNLLSAASWPGRAGPRPWPYPESACHVGLNRRKWLSISGFLWIRTRRILLTGTMVTLAWYPGRTRTRWGIGHSTRRLVPGPGWGWAAPPGGACYHAYAAAVRRVLAVAASQRGLWAVCSESCVRSSCAQWQCCPCMGQCAGGAAGVDGWGGGGRCQPAMPWIRKK